MYFDPIHELQLAHTTMKERNQRAEQARLRAYFKQDRPNLMNTTAQKLGTLLIAVGTWLESGGRAPEQPVAAEPRP